MELRARPGASRSNDVRNGERIWTTCLIIHNATLFLPIESTIWVATFPRVYSRFASSTTCTLEMSCFGPYSIERR